MMTKVETKKGRKNGSIFPMREMGKGQVCYCVEGNCYILKVQHQDGNPVFLILDGHRSINSYDYTCTLLVRELYEGESVTIKFSQYKGKNP